MTSSGEELPSEEMEDALPPLLQAAKDADVAAFKSMLEAGDDVLQKDEHDRTVLHWAAQSGSVPIIVAGVSRGLAWHINAKSKRGLTPLHEASLAGYVRTVHILLSIGADMTSQTQEGYTPLLCAAGNGHNDVARALVGAGCNPNQILLRIGVNALHIAAWTDQPDVLRDLLRLGGDVRSKSKTGKMAIDFALEQNHTDCVTVIRDHEEKLKRELKVQLEEQEGFFRTKLNYLADKIHKYYDERLKQEIEYFEKQLQDQHDKDNSIVLKLKRRINQLLKTEFADDEGDDDDGQMDDVEEQCDANTRGRVGVVGEEMGRLSPHPPEDHSSSTLKVSLRRRRRSSQFAHRPGRFSITSPSGASEHHESSDDESVQGVRRRYDRQISVDGHRQPRRPASGKGKSMIELVDDVSKRRTSVNYVRRQSSTTYEVPERNQNSKPHGVPTIRLLKPSKPSLPRSASPSQPMSVTTSNSSRSPSPPPFSPFSTSTSGIGPAPSTIDSVFDMDEAETKLAQPKSSRRSSIAAFFRPNLKPKANTNAVEKSRRKSVDVQRPDPSAPAKQVEKPRKKGFSLFSGQLPLLPGATMIEEERYSSEDVDMENSGHH